MDEGWDDVLGHLGVTKDHLGEGRMVGREEEILWKNAEN